jgi:glycine reductase
MGNFPVRRIVLGERAHYDGGTLEVDIREFALRMAADPAIGRVTIDVAHPGEAARVVHILETLEPRVKVAGGGEVFPGFLGPADHSGRGRLHRLGGMTLMTAGYFPDVLDPNMRQKEAIVDMSGPVSALSPFSRTVNLVVTCDRAPGADAFAFDRAVREAGLKGAVYLAESTRALDPPALDVFELDAGRPGVPGIALILQLGTKAPHGLQGTGLLRDMFLYGRTVHGILPTLIHPNDLLEGAVVANDFHYAGYRNPTYAMQHNPLVMELYAGHGRRWNFKGVVLTRGYYHTQEEKERAAQHAAKLAHLLGADGAVVTTQGGGNSHIDAMLTVQRCEWLGIRACLVMAELGGVEGMDSGLTDFVDEADLLISTGNIDELVEFPAMTNVLGGSEIIGTQVPTCGPFQLPTRVILLANSQVGMAPVACRPH